MEKNIFVFIFIIILLKISCQNIKLGSIKLDDSKLGETIEKKLEEDDDLNSYEEDHTMSDIMKVSIKEYIQEKKWNPEEQIDKETFKKMFVYLIQKGALKQGSSSLLKKLADKILEKHGEPILVKNLEKYFDIEELTLTYTRLLNPGKSTDL